MNITYERAHQLLDYCQETGIFIRRAGNRYLPGRVAGTINSKGRLSIKIDGSRFQAHRLAWLMVHGYAPELQIDHINRNPLDNRICNLRLATPHQNTCNRGGVRGYTKHKCGKFQASIKVRGKSLHLGLFNTAEEARSAYLKASVDHHGEFGVAA